MSRLSDLPPDQRAVLSLLLRQRKSYADVAGLLDIEPRAVHDRAHVALAMLAPSLARELSPAEREQIGEYLLAQQSASEQAETRSLMQRSPAARSWARALADELASLSSTSLPEIPDAGGPPSGPAQSTASAHDAGASGGGRGGSSSPDIRGSRRAGAVLLGVLAVAIVVVVIVVISRSGGTSSNSSSSTGTSSTASNSSTGSSTTGSSSSTTGTSSGSGKAKVDKQINLDPPAEVGGKAAGIVYILSEGKEHAFYVVAEGLPTLPSGTLYAVWLENSSSEAEPLGSLPAPASKGDIEGGGPLASTASRYHHVIITRETSRKPKAPGPIVLTGTFALK